MRKTMCGPIARVAARTVGPVLTVYALTVLAAGLAAGLAWWALTGLVVGATALAGVMAVAGFRTAVERCPRCNHWAELLLGAGGQALCGSCWAAITKPGEQ
jgi:hypothetical protein